MERERILELEQKIIDLRKEIDQIYFQGNEKYCANFTPILKEHRDLYGTLFLNANSLASSIRRLKEQINSELGLE